MPKQKNKKGMGFFFLLSFFFSIFLSFFLSLGCIWYLFFNLEFEVLCPVTNILYWNLEHKTNIFLSKKLCTGRKKSERKSTSLYHSIYRRKCKNYFFSQKKPKTKQPKKTPNIWAWFFPSITEQSSLRLVELGRVMLAEKMNLKIFFADKGTLTSSTWRLVSCDCMLLERPN